MQEEVENRTVNLAISTTKLTGRTIIAGIRKYLQHREKVKMKKARDPAVHGKQSVKQLLGIRVLRMLRSTKRVSVILKSSPRSTAWTLP